MFQYTPFALAGFLIGMVIPLPTCPAAAAPSPVDWMAKNGQLVAEARLCLAAGKVPITIYGPPFTEYWLQIRCIAREPHAP